jgi:iron complex transport system substrate-binding protein
MNKRTFTRCKGYIALVLILTGFVIVFLAACGGKSTASSGSTASTRSVIDQAGREVQVPEKVERVVIVAPWPLASVYCLYMGSGAKLVGVHPAIKSAGEYSHLMKVAPEIAGCETSFIQGDDINVEELMKLEPDVVLYSSSNPAHTEQMKNAGIPAVGFSVSIAQYNTVETVNRWVELLGQIFGEEDKAAGITEYGREVEAMIRERIKDIPKEKMPSALMLYHYDDTQILASGNTFFGQYWCDATGLRSVSENEKGSGINVNMEQIYEWAPEMIFVTNFVPYLSEDFYNNVIPAEDWSSVPAVMGRQVHKFPLGMYRWFPPSSDSALCLFWLAKTAHPELFGDIDLDKEIRDYYKRFYKVDLTNAEIEKIYNPPREAASGSF